jgi:enterochelin esterase-like enzyme
MAGLLVAACAPASSPAQPALDCPTLESAPLICEVPAHAADEPQSGSTCLEPGTLERYEIDSRLLNAPLHVSVYLPPCYDPRKAAGYPALYLLHGQTFDDSMWADLGATGLADEHILSGEWPPFMMIMPFEEFYYRKAAGNQYPVAIVEEVVPWVEETFNACSRRDCRALGGISRGASWTLRIGLNQWQVFGALGAHSLPDFLGGPDAVALWVDGIPKDQLPKITMDSGRLDAAIKTAYRTDAVLNEKGVPHTWQMNEGRHDEEYWRARMPDYMSWYAGLWAEGF